MPITYEIDDHRGVIFARAEGVFHGRGWLEARKAMLEDPAFRPGLDVVMDLREAEAGSEAPAEIMEGSQQFADLADRIGNIRVAVVAPGDALYGVAREWVVWLSRGHASVRVFRDMDEATKWLGLAE